MSVTVKLFEPGGLFFSEPQSCRSSSCEAHSHDLSLSLKLIRLRLLTVTPLTLSVRLDLYASAVDQIADRHPTSGR
jgi:hypothetical protein